MVITSVEFSPKIDLFCFTQRDSIPISDVLVTLLEIINCLMHFGNPLYSNLFSVCFIHPYYYIGIVFIDYPNINACLQNKLYYELRFNGYKFITFVEIEIS